jgi:hypothetical protein
LLFSPPAVSVSGLDSSNARTSRRSASLMSNAAAGRAAGSTSATSVPQYLYSEQTETSLRLALASVPTPTTHLPNSRSRCTRGE